MTFTLYIFCRYLKSMSFIAFAILSCAGSGMVTAQQIQFPKRWQESFYDIQPFTHQDTLKICMAGDVMMHSKQISDALTSSGKYDFLPWFEHVRDMVSSADISIANMEFPLAGEPYTGYPSFSAPEVIAECMAECGFDVLLAANNHIYDKGSKGAMRTVEIYRKLEKEHGVTFTGIAEDISSLEKNNPLILKKKNIRIAVINCTYGTNLGADAPWPKVNYLNNTEAMANALETAEKEADFTIVLPHWGIEYELLHCQDQEETARWLSDNGADLIAGSHPHTVQDAENISRNTQVAYSLGNMVSNMSAPDTQIGLMAEVRLIRTTDGRFKADPMEFTYIWCSRPGGYCSTYKILPVKKFLGTREQWQGKWEYDKMVSTYKRVMETTGIKDKQTL